MCQRHRTMSGRNPPEPLRRAVADCLSSSSLQYATPSAVPSEPVRTLRDYLASSSTVDVAYCVLLGHALAEKDRSPAVIVKCVEILKRYLLRYVPKETTLRQIDSFCVSSISECSAASSQILSPGLVSLSQSKTSTPSGNATSLLLPTTFSSGAVVKSLNYVRSLVSHHIPKDYIQPDASVGSLTAVKQSPLDFSSLLNTSSNVQLKHGASKSKESPENRNACSSPAFKSAVSGKDDKEGTKHVFADIAQWRWAEDRDQVYSVIRQSDAIRQAQDIRPHGFEEVGAAALLTGTMEDKIRELPWKYSNTLDHDRPLQISAVMPTTNVDSTRSHLRAITSFKRMKPGPDQLWKDISMSTFHPRARPLFHYKPYSAQHPLRLNPAEISEVLASICSEDYVSEVTVTIPSSRMRCQSGRPSVDVAVSVLVKLIIDMYVLEPQTAAPLTLFMLQEMLKSEKLIAKTRVFDLIINLGVHAHLLEPALSEISHALEEVKDSQQEGYVIDEPFTEPRAGHLSPKLGFSFAAVDMFEAWILSILYEILLFVIQSLLQTEERNEVIMASALSCLLFFVCDGESICRSRLDGLDIRVVKELLEISRECKWAKVVHNKLLCMLTNMLYCVSDERKGTALYAPVFIAEQVDLVGGIEFICMEYSQATTKEERRNLFMVLFDYALNLINEVRLANGDSAYSMEEIKELFIFLTAFDASEAFYIAVKYGVDGTGDILRRGISDALSAYPNFSCLNMLLDKVMRKIDEIVCLFTCVDKDFTSLIGCTSTCKFVESITDDFLNSDVVREIRLSWATLHSLLHSERAFFRRNGYIWLVQLLLVEISGDGKLSIWSNICNLQKQVSLAGNQDYSVNLSIPLSVWTFCGLVRSKHSGIRRGFLIVLEMLLMRCKILLEESEIVHLDGGVALNHRELQLEKAYAMIDIMSNALSLVSQINETDRIIILKMCDLLLSQLCLKFSSPVHPRHEDLTCSRCIFDYANWTEKDQVSSHTCQLQKTESHHLINFGHPEDPVSLLDYETSSLAALFLKGYAVVPMRLVVRVPASLFYWPLIQLANAATDDITLGIAVGSKGRCNLPDATSDIRASLLLLLIGKCTKDPSAFQEVGGEHFFRELLDDTDSRVAYYSSVFLLKRMMTEEHERYQRVLQILVYKAQQMNNEKLLENPYFQMRGIIHLSGELGM